MEFTGRIYQLFSNDGYFYIGSTKNQLSKRLYQHKADAKRDSNRYNYKYFNSIGWDNIKIVLIEELLCKNKDELTRKEYEYIQKHLENTYCLNIKNRAFDRKQWDKKFYQDNKEKIKTKKHLFYENNKQRLNKERVQRNKERTMCECGKELSKGSVWKHKKDACTLEIKNNNAVVSPTHQTDKTLP